MAHSKTSKRSEAKIILRLADLEQSKNAVLHSLGAAIMVCRGIKRPLEELWPLTKFYN